MKNLLLAVIFFLGALMAAKNADAQFSYNFETATNNATTFSSNSYNFSISATSAGPFHINASYPGTGWNGTSADNRYIDNDLHAAAGLATSFTITLTSGPASTIKVKSFYLYLGDNNANLRSSGQVTIVGKSGTTTVFTASASGPWNTSFGVNNGYNLVNLATFGGSDNSNQNITSITISTASNINYVGLDQLVWAAGAASATAPTVTTSAATAVTASGATLNGSINDNGAATTTSFDYSTDATLNTGVTNVAATPSPVSAGAGATSISKALTGLNSSTTYYFRAKGINSVNTTNGSILSFTTAAAPAVSATGTLSAFTTIAGTASASQNFSVSGSNLTTDITITAPTGYEVSKNNSAFSTSVTVTPTSGTVSSTTIYARLASTATGTPSGNISVAATGATTQNVAVSGTVNANITGAFLTFTACTNLTVLNSTASASSATYNFGPTDCDGNGFTAITEGTGVTASSLLRVQIASGATAMGLGFNRTGTTAAVTNMHFKTTSGAEFKLTSFDIIRIGDFNQTYTIKAYKDGVLVPGSTITKNYTVGGGIMNITSSDLGTNYDNIDEIILTTTVANGLIIDNIKTAAPIVSPAVVATGNLSAFTTTTGTASASQNFSVSGSNLTADITVTAPTGFEVSKDNTSFSNSVTVTPSSGTVSSTTIYARLSSAATGTPSGNITIASTGATSKTVAVSGTVTTPAIVATGTLSAFTATTGTASASQNFSVSGSNLTADITVTAPTGFEVSKDNTSFSNSLTVTPSSGTVSSTTIYARLSSAATGTPSGNITIASTGATSKTVAVSGTVTTPAIVATGTLSAFTATTGTASASQNFSVSGSNLTADITVTAPTGFEVSKDNTSFSNSLTVTPSSGTVSSTTIYARLFSTATGTPSGNISVASTGATTQTVAVSGTVNALTPDVAATGTLSAFTATTGTASASQNFSVSGSNLTADITVTAPTGFEVSKDNTSFSGSVTVTPSSGTVSSTTIYARLSSAATGTPSGNITITSTGATSKTVAVSGTVTTPAIVATGTLSAFTAITGTASASQNFSVSGSNLTADITVTAPTGFEVSKDNTSFSNSVTVTPSSGTVSSTTIYARLSSAATGTPSGNITIASTGATSKTVAVSGTVTTPAVVATGTLSAFTAITGTASASQNFSVSGSNLTADITVTAPTGFEVSKDNTSFSNSATVTPSGGTVSSTTIYARLSSTATGTPSGNITIASTGATSKTVAVSGTVNAASPVIAASGILSAVNTTYGTASATPTSFTVSGSNLTANISASAPSGFEISTSSTTGYSSIITLSQSGGSYSGTVYVRLAANTTPGNYSGNISLTSAGATTQNVATAQSTVDKKALTITLNNTPAITKTYNGNNNATVASGNYVINGSVGLDQVTVSGTGTYDDANVGGTKTITVTTFVLGGAQKDYYTVSTTSATVNGSISAYSISVTADAKSKNYGDTDPALTYTNSPLLGTDALTGALTRDAGENVSSYAIKQGTLTAGNNYSISFTSANLTINKATATLALSGLTTSYDGTAKAVTVTTTPANLTTVAITYDGSATAPTNAGSYAVVAKLTNANYTATDATGTLVIGAAGQTITFNALTNKTYGAADFDPAATSTNSGNPITYASSNTTVATIVAGKVHIVGSGTTTITASQAGDANHTAASDKTQQLTVDPKALTLTLNAVPSITKTYDKTNSATLASGNYTLNGLINSDAVTVSGTATYDDVNRGAGKTVTASGFVLAGAKKDNYTLTTTTATTTGSISARQVTVTADAQTKTYGTSDPALTYSPSAPLISGDSFTGALARITGEDAGSYGITQGTLSAGSNYDINYVGANLSITQATATLALSNLTHVYDGTAKTATVTTTPGSLTGVSVTYDGSATAPTNVGNYAVVAKLNNINYTATDATGTLTIGKAAAAISFNALAAKTYGDADFDPSATSDNSQTPVTYASGNTAVATVVSGKIHIVGAGTTIITASQAADANHTAATDKTQSLTVTPKSVTLTLSGTPSITKIYDATNSATLVAGNYVLSGIINNDGVNVTGNATYADADKGAGKTITANGFILAGSKKDNYTLTTTTATTTGSISARPVTLVADAKSKTYGDTDPSLTYQITAGNLVGSDTFTGALTRAAGENAGTYAITQGTLTAGNNYSISFTGANLTIGTKSILVTASAQSKTYGDSDPALTYTNTALVGADTFTGGLTRDAGENVGTYAIKQGTLALSSNYTLSYSGANFTIGAKAITVTASAQNKTYGDADPTLTYNITSGALVGADVFTGSLTRDAGENAGTYAIKQGTLALTSNYALSYTGANLVIGTKAITVTAAAKSKTYGDADPMLTYTNTSLVGADTFTGSLTRDAGENVGTYTIKQGTLALSSNYTLSYSGANFTISAKAITVTAIAKSKTYGDADPALTYTNTPLVGADSFTGSLTRDAGENVGTYAIKQGTLALSANYTLNYTGANLAIGAKAITVTAVAKTKTYGDADPVLTYTNTTLIGADTFTGSLTRDAGENIGVYPVKQGSLALSANYSLTYTGANLTIGTKTINVTAVAKSKTYGTPDPALTYTFSPALVSGDSFSGALTRVAGQNTGAYAINQGTLALSNNYVLNYTGDNLTISNAVLTVTAQNQSKIYGAANPTLTVAYSGFVNGDTQAALTAQASATTTATALSGAGTYVINAAGAVIPNYTVTYVPGTLTVNKAVLNITADDKSRNYGVANPTLTVTYSGFVNGDIPSNLTTQPVITTNAAINSQPGKYPIVASGAASPNYTFTYSAGTFTVIPLTNATLSNLAISSGSLSPSFSGGTYNYQASVIFAVDQITLTPTFDPTATISINGSASGNGSASAPIALIPGDNTITLTVTAQDGTTKLTYLVKVHRAVPPNAIVANNVLSPNGDGKNDAWVIKDIQLYPNNTVRVFDRAGREVYSKRGYNNDWDATLKGTPLAQGTYYYVVDLGPGYETIKGFITVLRAQ